MVCLGRNFTKALTKTVYGLFAKKLLTKALTKSLCFVWELYMSRSDLLQFQLQGPDPASQSWCTVLLWMPDTTVPKLTK